MTLGIVLLGAPGAGKDTLVDQLNKKLDCIVVSPGSLYRREASLGTAFGLDAKRKYWGKGKLCPDSMTNDLVKATLSDNNLSHDYILFNGYPRSLGQAEFLETIFNINLVIDLSVTRDTSVTRLLARGREDDTENTIKSRFEEYSDNNAKVVEFYKQLSVHSVVNANQIAHRVLAAALPIIESLEK